MKIADNVKNEFQAVKITWLDTTNYEGWFDSKDELPVEPLEMETLGWLVKQTDDVAVIAMTVSKYKIGEILVIPAGCIEEIKTNSF